MKNRKMFFPEMMSQQLKLCTSEYFQKIEIYFDHLNVIKSYIFKYLDFLYHLIIEMSIVIQVIK